MHMKEEEAVNCPHFAVLAGILLPATLISFIAGRGAIMYRDHRKWVAKQDQEQKTMPPLPLTDNDLGNDDKLPVKFSRPGVDTHSCNAVYKLSQLLNWTLYLPGSTLSAYLNLQAMITTLQAWFKFQYDGFVVWTE